MLSSGLNVYLSNFIAPFVGDKPMQFFLHELIYSNNPSVPSALKNVVPFTGPLHISLNARECVLLNLPSICRSVLLFVCKESKVGKEAKAVENIIIVRSNLWGWTLIRDMVLSVFHKCKDTEFPTLLNLLDNYTPLVLSIYSIV